jgi:predicted nucleotidyltransferase
VEAAFIFGSEARGDTHPHSDIDLFIVGREDVHYQASAAFSEVETLFDRDIDVILYTTEQVTRRIGRETGFVPRVAREPKVFVVGHSAAIAELLAEAA